MLHSRKLPLNLWGKAANTSVFVWNHTVNKQLSTITPFEKMFSQVPDVSFFRVFGSAAYLHIPKKQRTKLAAKSQKLILVGYESMTRKAEHNTKRICVGVDVIIHETLSFSDIVPSYTDTQDGNATIFLQPIVSSPTVIIADNIPTFSDRPSDVHDSSIDIFPEHDTTTEAYYETNSAPIPTLDIPTTQIQGEILPDEQEDMTHPIPAVFSTPQPGSTSTLQDQQSDEPISVPLQQGELILQSPCETTSIQPTSTCLHNYRTNIERDNSFEAGTSSTAQDAETPPRLPNTGTIPDIETPLPPCSRQPPIRYGEWIKYDNNKSKEGSAAYLATQSTHIPEPKTYQEAMRSPHAQKWKEAMTKEFTSLIANRTWVLKPLPKDRKAVKFKWIYKVKYKPSGEIERFKARLMAKGFSQVAGVDFTGTYAPVIKYDVVRAVFVISNAHGMFKAQFDVCTAYLNAYLIDVIFMEQPKRFEDLDWPLYVCLLLKSLSGLKQSARRWNKTFDKFAKQFDLLPSIADPCVYCSTDIKQTDKIETILGILSMTT